MASDMRFDFFSVNGEPPNEPIADLPERFPFFDSEAAGADAARAAAGGDGPWAADYIADQALVDAVNTAICVGQPLLVTGEAGCGKTQLADVVAYRLGLGEPLRFYTRSTSRAQDVLYTFDAVRRFSDIQARLHERAREAKNYIQWGALGEAIVNGEKRVVLIDEIDKAPRDFPNDLLRELDKMEFEVAELDGEDRKQRATRRPIVIITSNSERQLPAPFLRRCVFHTITFPDDKSLQEIVRRHLRRCPGVRVDENLIRVAVAQFRKLRNVKGWSKIPGTGELLAWTYALAVRGLRAEEVEREPLNQLPLRAALIKDGDDLRRLPDRHGLAQGV